MVTQAVFKTCVLARDSVQAPHTCIERAWESSQAHTHWRHSWPRVKIQSCVQQDESVTWLQPESCHRSAHLIWVFPPKGRESGLPKHLRMLCEQHLYVQTSLWHPARQAAWEEHWGDSQRTPQCLGICCPILNVNSTPITLKTPYFGWKLKHGHPVYSSDPPTPSGDNKYLKASRSLGRQNWHHQKLGRIKMYHQCQK